MTDYCRLCGSPSVWSDSGHCHDCYTALRQERWQEQERCLAAIEATAAEMMELFPARENPALLGATVAALEGVRRRVREGAP